MDLRPDLTAHFRDFGVDATVPDVGGAPIPARVIERHQTVQVDRGDGFVTTERRLELTIRRAEMPVRTRETPIIIGDKVWRLDQVVDEDDEVVTVLVH